MKKTSIVICDDHPIFRHGLIKTIESNVSFEIVGEYGDGDSAWKFISEVKPEIAILDISVPGKSGLDIARLIISENLLTKPIILTMFKEKEYFNEAIDIGVKGYLLKDNAINTLEECIERVRNGHFYVTPYFSDQLINKTNNYMAESKETIEKSQIDILSDIERIILRYVGESKTSREIANELNLSYRTVQNHRMRIMKKLKLKGYHGIMQFVANLTKKE